MRIATLLCALAFLVWVGGFPVVAVGGAIGLAGWVAELVWPGVFKWPRKPPPKPVDPDALRDDPVF